MTLETLAKDISKSAKAEADAMIAEAQKEADVIVAEATAKAVIIRSEAASRTEREATQLAREIVASARQANQKEILVARRKVLDATLAMTHSELSSPKMKGRASLLKSLMAKADEIGNDFNVRPVEMIERHSRNSLESEEWVTLFPVLEDLSSKQPTARYRTTCVSTHFSKRRGKTN